MGYFCTKSFLNFVAQEEYIQSLNVGRQEREILFISSIQGMQEELSNNEIPYTELRAQLSTLSEKALSFGGIS